MHGCEAKRLFLLNQSSWSVTEEVTMTNKSYLLQKLVFEEVITRREGSLKAFRHRLNHLGLVPLLQSFPDMMKPLFVVQPTDNRELSLPDCLSQATRGLHLTSVHLFST